MGPVRSYGKRSARRRKQHTARVEQVATVGELQPDEIKLVEVSGKAVILINHAGAIYALAGECTHADAPLEEWFVDDGCLTCPWHGGVFDIKTGEPTAPPPMLPIPRYKVRMRDDPILVDVGETLSESIASHLTLINPST